MDSLSYPMDLMTKSDAGFKADAGPPMDESSMGASSTHSGGANIHGAAHPHRAHEGGGGVGAPMALTTASTNDDDHKSSMQSPLNFTSMKYFLRGDIAFDDEI